MKDGFRRRTVHRYASAWNVICENVGDLHLSTGHFQNLESAVARLWKITYKFWFAALQYSSGAVDLSSVSRR